MAVLNLEPQVEFRRYGALIHILFWGRISAANLN